MERFLRRVLLLTAAALALGAWSATLFAENGEELFPGVKNFSNEDLDRQIEAFDRQHHIPADEAFKTASKKSALEAAQAPNPKHDAVNVSATSAAGAVTASATSVTMSDGTKLVSRAAYLKKLSEQTDYMASYLVKAKAIRDTVRWEASLSGSSTHFITDGPQANDSEAFNQWLLRYFINDIRHGTVQAPYAVNYLNKMMFPLTICRHAYTVANANTERAKKIIAAPDAMPEDKAAAEALIPRLEVIRHDALFNSAVVFCLIRNLDATGRLYDVLLDQYPHDAEIAAAYKHYLRILHQPRSISPPRGQGD